MPNQEFPLSAADGKVPSTDPQTHTGTAVPSGPADMAADATDITPTASPVSMTPAQFSQALADLGLTQADYARLIDVSQKTIWTWTSGRTAVPKLASEHLGVLLALQGIHRRFLGH